VLQTGTTTTTFYPFKWYSVASSTGTGAKYSTTTSYMFNGDTLLATVTSTNEKRKYIEQFSDDSGLSYFNARYHYGAQGQFISEDPVVAEDYLATFPCSSRNQVSGMAEKLQSLCPTAYLQEPFRGKTRV
jgi:hypothetical protein